MTRHEQLTTTSRVDTGDDIAAHRHDPPRHGGLARAPRRALAGTLALAVLATLGQVVIPIVVQQTLDRGLNGPNGPDVGFMVEMGLVATLAIVVTGVASYFMTSRLFTTAETGLATLRIKAFRHVHDLPVLTQNTERRGALVSRVTSDVDQVSQFLVFGGILFVVSVLQIGVATVIMLFYSWQLTLVVWLCFLPLFASLRYFQRRLSDAYGTVRRQVGDHAVGDLRAGRRCRGGPLVRRRGAHPGPHRHRDPRAPGGQHPRPGLHGVLVLARRSLGRSRQRRAC